MRRYLAPFDPPDDDVDLLVELTAGASPALLRTLAEGVKRTLVVGPKVGRKIDNPRAVFASVVAACAPAPEYTPPDLWEAKGLDEIVRISWPWPKEGAQ
jgi:hypothetical protein